MCQQFIENLPEILLRPGQSPRKHRSANLGARSSRTTPRRIPPLDAACPHARTLSRALELLLRGGPGDLRAAADTLAALLEAHRKAAAPVEQVPVDRADHHPAGQPEKQAHGLRVEQAGSGHLGTASFASAAGVP
jgi:hypothetical protein